MPGGQTPPRRGQTLARAWVASGPTRAPPALPLRLFNLSFGKTLYTREKIHKKFRKPPSSTNPSREGSRALPGTLPEGEITTGGLLHRHACLRDDVLGVHHRTTGP